MKTLSPAVLTQLFEAAKSAQHHAYAPYSHFPVGASLLTASDAIFSGCNIENASFPVGLCAEASAVGAMVTAGHQKIKAIVVVLNTAEKAFPCGMCLQRLSEFSDDETLVYIANSEGIQREYLFGELFPKRFSAKSLAK